MRRPLYSAALAAVLAAGSGTVPALASTIKPVGFAEMVQRASVVAQGRVVNVESFWGRGAEIAHSDTAAKESKAPARGAVTAAAAAAAQGAAPQSLGTKGGRMIFTRVRLEVEATVKGEAGSEVELVVAGGTIGDTTAEVVGMPRFEKGGRYLLFLRDAYPTHAVPMVGVNQGFFRVVRDDRTGRDLLQRANGEYVTGVEGDRVVGTLAPAGRPQARQTGAPVPDVPGVTATAPLRAQALRSTPVSLDEFTQAIRARIGRR
jgi:hypothetical protein